MTTHLASISCLLAATLALASPTRGDDASDRQHELNDGYYLLHHLADDESKLPILLDLKHAPDNVVAFADQVSVAGKKTVAALEDFHDRDRALQFEKNPLPRMEQNVRESIQDEKQHQLLFGTKDAEFVRALCVAQIEASTYAGNLCKVIADEETNQARAKELRQLEQKWRAIHANAEQILRNY